MPDVDEELLTPEGMARARAALTARYQWFIHIKPTRKFELIKCGGLQPRSQGVAMNISVYRSIDGIVQDVEEIICLRPLGIGVQDSTPYRGDRMFTLAISANDLPEIITLDWTMGQYWGAASIIKDCEPHREDADIFCEVVRRSGSVVIYETIPADRLRVWTTGLQLNDPSSWPLLVNTELVDAVVT